MHHHLIEQHLAFEVMHDLVDVDSDFILTASRISDRLNVRIDHRPLTRPVAAHAIPSMNVAAFHSICPCDILAHGCKYRLHVTGVKPGINAFEKLYFVRHWACPRRHLTFNSGRFVSSDAATSARSTGI